MASGTAFFDWRGPLLACGVIGEARDSCRGTDLIDFRNIVDWLRYNVCSDEIFTYYIADGTIMSDKTPNARENARENARQARARITEAQLQRLSKFHERPSVKGIGINCVGGQKTFGIPTVEEVILNLTHPIFKRHDIPDIATCIGIPLATMREPPSQAWENATDLTKFDNRNPLENEQALFLHLSWRDDAKTGRSWGKAQKPWQESVGSVIVVRKDEMPLEKIHIEALLNGWQGS